MGGTNYIIEQRESDQALVIKGPVHSEYLDELRAALIDSLSKSDKVVIKITELEHITSAFNQLLCSACRTSHREGKTILLEGRDLEPVNELAHAIGTPLSSCHCEDSRHCLQA